MHSALIGIDLVREAYREAVANRYRWHEFSIAWKPTASHAQFAKYLRPREART